MKLEDLKQKKRWKFKEQKEREKFLKKNLNKKDQSLKDKEKQRFGNMKEIEKLKFQELKRMLVEEKLKNKSKSIDMKEKADQIEKAEFINNKKKENIGIKKLFVRMINILILMI